MVPDVGQVQLASTIRVFRFVRIVRLVEGSKSGLLVIARGAAQRASALVFGGADHPGRSRDKSSGSWGIQQ